MLIFNFDDITQNNVGNIVPDLVDPGISDRSLLSVLSFSSPIPFWLIDQLKRIVRVESIDDGLKLQGSEEWITALA